jgi:hypothetical protein
MALIAIGRTADFDRTAKFCDGHWIGAPMPDFDRAAFHQDFGKAVVGFFKAQLALPEANRAPPQLLT